MKLESEAFEEHLLSEQEMAQSSIGLSTQIEEVCMLDAMLIERLLEYTLNLTIFLLSEQSLRLDNQTIYLLEEVFLRIDVEGFGRLDWIIIKFTLRGRSIHASYRIFTIVMSKVLSSSSYR